MSSKRLLLASLAAAACLVNQGAFATGADDTWLEYAKANGMPLTRTSDPPASDDWILAEMTLSDGYTDRMAILREVHARKGGMGEHVPLFASREDKAHASDAPQGVGQPLPRFVDPCGDTWAQEVARTDGNPRGDDLRCAKAP